MSPWASAVCCLWKIKEKLLSKWFWWLDVFSCSSCGECYCCCCCCFFLLFCLFIFHLRYDKQLSLVCFVSDVKHTQSNSGVKSFHLSWIELIEQHFQPCLGTGWGLFIKCHEIRLLVGNFHFTWDGSFRFSVSQDDLMASAFIRGDLNAATKGPVILSLISYLFFWQGVNRCQEVSRHHH